VTSEETVSTDDDDLKRHGYSGWATYNIDRLPVAVAYPKSTEEVSKIAKVCHKYRIPMIPFSGGSVSTIVQTNRQLLILQVYRR
jgi:D-lactate dehydrogenase (cytochrome)